MSEHAYKMIELVSSSHTSIEAAVQNAIAKAEQDESKLRWFEVIETRGHIEDGNSARSSRAAAAEGGASTEENPRRGRR